MTHGCYCALRGTVEAIEETVAMCRFDPGNDKVYPGEVPGGSGSIQPSKEGNKLAIQIMFFQDPHHVYCHHHYCQ